MFERLEDPSEASAVLLDVPEEWATVRNTAEELLRAQTKDLEIAAGLTEALVRRNGFPGLRDGFDLIFGLVDRFWDSGLYPPPEDEGARDTVAPIAGLNGEATEGPLLQHVRNVPLTERNTGVYAFWHQRMVESGSTAVTSLEIEAALGGTSGEKLKALSADLAAAAESLAAVDTALTNVLGRDAPSVRRVQEELEAIQAFLHRTVGSRIGVVGGGETPAASIATASGADTVVAEAGASRSGSGSTASSNVHPLPSAIRSREEAFETLQKVALYFRQAEPHSPMSYVLDELVRRGQLSFPELMQELIPDQTTRWDFLTRMGIQPEQHDPESTGL
jgi:type VI secretion system protein ImpA